MEEEQVMKKFNLPQMSLSIPLILGAVAFNSSAMADYTDIEIKSISVHQISVKSNGSAYIATDTPNVSINAHLTLDAGLSGRVKSWKAWASIIGVGFDGLERTHYKENAASQTYPSGSRPKRVDKRVNLFIPGFRLRSLATNYCNEIRYNFLSGGRTNEWVMSEDRTFDFLIDPELNYDLSGVKGTKFVGAFPEDVRTIHVTCAKYVPKTANTNVAAVPGTQPKVMQVSTTIFPEAANDGSYCRVRISGVLTSNKLNMPLTYRYGYDDFDPNTPPKFSAPISVQTDHSKTVMVSDVYDVPVVSGPERGRIWIESTAPNSLDSTIKNFDMNCSKSLSVQVLKPIQKTVKFTPNQTLMFGNQQCPTGGHIVVVLKGSGTAFEGTGRVTVKNKFGQSHSSGPQNVSLAANGTTFFGMPYQVKWGATGPSFGSSGGNAQVKEQTLRYTLALQREGEMTTSTPPEQNLKVQCDFLAIDQVGRSAGSMTLGAQNSGQSTAQSSPRNKTATGMKLVASKPDLQVQKVQQTGKQRLKVLVVNKGSGTAAASYVSLVGGRNNQVEKPLASLRPGQKKWVTLRLPKLSKSAKIEVDSRRQVRELNENNNQKSHSFK